MSFKPNLPKLNLHGKVYRNQVRIPSKIKRSMTNAEEIMKKLRILLTLFYMGSGRYVVTWGGVKLTPPC